MLSKKIITIAITLGSIIGGYIPVFFGAGGLSVMSLLGSTIGGIAGIYIAYKLSNY